MCKFATICSAFCWQWNRNRACWLLLKWQKLTTQQWTLRVAGWTCTKLGPPRCHTFSAAKLGLIRRRRCSHQGICMHFISRSSNSTHRRPHGARSTEHGALRSTIHPCPLASHINDNPEIAVYSGSTSPSAMPLEGGKSTQPSGNKLQTTLSCCPLCQVSLLDLSP